MDSMIEAMDLPQVLENMRKIESMFRSGNGDVNLMKMTEQPTLYETWRQLREKARRMKKK